MRQVTISELSSLENKENIPSIRGTIYKLYDYKTGEGSQGAWSIQNGYMRDSTGESKILITNQPDAKRYLNREVLITSHKSDKGLSGIYAHDDEYKGKVSRIVKLTASAGIAFVDASSKAAEGSRARPDSETVSGQPKDAVSAFKRSLMKVLNAFYIIERAVSLEVDQSKIDGFESTPEHIQAKCATAFITLDRQGLVQSLPDKALWGAEKQLAENPPEDEEIPWE